MAIVVVSTTLKTTFASQPDANTARYSITLTNGSGSDRCLVVISARRRGGIRTLDSSTFDSTAGTVFANIGIDGGQAIGSGVVVYLDSELPASAGTYNLDVVWSDSGTADKPCIVIEFTGVDQAALLANFSSNTATSVTDGNTISATLSGASGLFAISYVAMADTGAFTVANTIPSGTTDVGDAGETSCTMSAAYDTSAATASEAYQWTVDIGIGTIDSVVTGVFSIAAAAAGGDISINATTESLTVTTNTAVVSSDIAISASAESILLTTFASTISLDASIDIVATTESISVSTFTATIQLGADVSIEANLESIAVSTFSALIGVSIDIPANLESITVTANNAIIDLDADILISANAEQINLLTFSATIEGVSGVWTKQPDSTTNWASQPDATTTWSEQADNSTTWTIQ